MLVPVFMLFVIPFPDWLLEAGFLSRELAGVNRFILEYGNYIAAALFILAASTDCIDGYLARKTKQVTVLGKFLDPIADKLLVTAALIALLQRNEVGGWAAMIIIAREFIVTGLRLVAAGEGIVIAASGLGKLKTVTQMVAIVAALLKDFPISLLTDVRFDRVAMLAAVVITVYSGYDYLKKNIQLLTKSNNTEKVRVSHPRRIGIRGLDSKGAR